MGKEKRIYELTAVSRLKEKGKEPEENRYRLVYNVHHLDTDESKAFVYDKELKMHFENPSGVTHLYEIETEETEFTFCDRLKKSEELNRLLFLRYDFFRVRLSAGGKIVSIENETELKDTWPLLKKKISGDYKGPRLKAYLEDVDVCYARGKLPKNALFRYLHLGLLIPQIPADHSDGWVMKRGVQLSEYEEETFDERVVYSGVVEGDRLYRVTGEKREEKKSRLGMFEGEIRMNPGELFPVRSTRDAAFNWGEDIEIGWHFELTRKK